METECFFNEKVVKTSKIQLRMNIHLLRNIIILLGGFQCSCNIDSYHKDFSEMKSKFFSMIHKEKA